MIWLAYWLIGCVVAGFNYFDFDRSDEQELSQVVLSIVFWPYVATVLLCKSHQIIRRPQTPVARASSPCPEHQSTPPDRSDSRPLSASRACGCGGIDCPECGAHHQVGDHPPRQPHHTHSEAP